MNDPHDSRMSEEALFRLALEELDRLRTENARLTRIQQETLAEAMRQASELRTENDTLRELVREANRGQRSPAWFDRAEKELNGK